MTDEGQALEWYCKEADSGEAKAQKRFRAANKLGEFGFGAIQYKAPEWNRKAGGRRRCYLYVAV